MTKKQWKRLSRERQLELLAGQTEKANRLRQENKWLREWIADHEQYMTQMGGLTEAILHSGNLDGEKANLVYEYFDQLRESAGEDGAAEEEELSDTADWPAPEQLLAEAQRAGGRSRRLRGLKTALFVMVIAAAAVVLAAVLALPVLQIHGASMSPTLNEGDLVVCIKGGKTSAGDLLAFYYNSSILVKRVIAGPGQWVNMDRDGTVYVDNVKLDEPYLIDKAYGECDIQLPCRVPENRVFVMGDNRSDSVDSRSTVIGCIPEEQMAGKIVLRIWPLSGFGLLRT